jgi:thiol-disulfide isomerase/thioredoxin
MRSPFRQLLNQHSYVLTVLGILVFAFVVGLLFDRRVRLALVGAVLAVAVVVFAWLRTGQGDVRSESDFDVTLESGRPVALEFYSDYCLACLSAKPVFAALEGEFSGRATFVRADLTSAAGQRLAARYRVDTVPTFLAFDRDGKLALELEGNPGVPVTELRRALMQALD